MKITTKSVVYIYDRAKMTRVGTDVIVPIRSKAKKKKLNKIF